MGVVPRTAPAYRSPTCQVALAALEAGMSVLPIRPDGTKQPALSGWKRYQQEMPPQALVEKWFRNPQRGLALVTGHISGGLIALDFDDLATFDAWLRCIQREQVLYALYEYIASGYEERTPKNGRHLLFRCTEAFRASQRPGNQRLALRPMPEPQRVKVLAETREEGGIIIVDPSRGSVHPSGKPYVRIRGGISTIRAISPEERVLLYNSIRAFDEMPPLPPRESSPQQQFRPMFHYSGRSGEGERPGDLFDHDPSVTWEALLPPLGWQLVRTDEKGEGYWRHPGKVGPTHSATTNADGTNRLFCFSAATGLPLERYLTRFEFYAWWCHGGDFSAAARALAERGYTTHREAQFAHRGG
jgi:Bifunctional DNA primase/polymerase, N-terminal